MTTINTSKGDNHDCQMFVNGCLGELVKMEILNSYGNPDMWYSGIEAVKYRNFECFFSCMVDFVRLENMERFEEILNSFGYRIIKHTFVKHDLVVYFELIQQ